jgi:L-asparaginase II
LGNPVLVEITRGNSVESVHRGAFAVFDGDGACVLSAGDIERPVYPRSAVKAIQALPLIESGAADRFGFGNRELALACASHSAEPAHIETALHMLAAAGLGEDALECGAHWPFDQPVLIAMARTGRAPTQVCNNCSGKHAGFLCMAVHENMAAKGYVRRDHKVQERVREAMQAVTGAAHGADNCGTDGCSIPTYAIPLRSLALGFARMATGNGLGAARDAAATRLIGACMVEPFFVAGTKRADTEMMRAAPGRIFVKTGAEGVYCGALPELGFGFALKCDDGAARASEAICAAILSEFLGRYDPAEPALRKWSTRTLKNWAGTDVGTIRAVQIGPLS